MRKEAAMSKCILLVLHLSLASVIPDWSESLLLERPSSTFEDIAKLVRSLQEPDGAVRLDAVEALGQLGPDAAEAIPALVTIIRSDPDASVRRAAIDAVLQISKVGKIEIEARSLVERVGKLETYTTAALSTALDDADAGVRSAAIKALGQLDPKTPNVVSGLIKGLGDQDPALRLEAVDALGGMHPKTRAMMFALLNMRKDPEPSVRVAAAHIFGERGIALLESTGALQELLVDPDAYVRQAAAERLRQLNPKPVYQLTSAINRLQGLDPKIRLEAAQALAKQRLEDPEARSILHQLLSSEEVQDQEIAAYILWHAEHRCEEVLPTLMQVLEANSQARNPERGGFRYSGPMGIIGYFMQGLFPPLVALTALAEMGPAAAPAVPTLVRILTANHEADAHARPRGGSVVLPDWVQSFMTTEETPERVRSLFEVPSICSVLAKIGPEARAAVPILTEFLKDDDAGICLSAAQALWMIDPGSQSALRVVLIRLDSKNWMDRIAAARLVGEMGPSAKAAIPCLVKLLRDRDPNCKAAGIQALGKMGSAATAVLPSLQPLLKDKDRLIRVSATIAIGCITQQPSQAAPL